MALRLPRSPSLRVRFGAAYALLALLLAGTALATARAVSFQRPRPYAPAAVAVVNSFLSAVQAGDKATACRFFSALPSCSSALGVFARHYRVFPAQRGVASVDVPVTIDGDYGVIHLAPFGHTYRIVDIIAASTILTAAAQS